MGLNQGLIYTNSNCIGCHKCIQSCSCIGACVATVPDTEGNFRVEVDSDKCILCGACFDVCEHNAREYRDDTERFFEDLSKGKKITVLVAPSFKVNYPDKWQEVLGGLETLGVSECIDISFGADITTWGYLNYITCYNFTGGISQPCPAVVGYIEKYLPELISKLIPVQSPLMCAATYLRIQDGLTDDFAFISPCIAKKSEIDDINNKGLVSYNVTFKHLMNYVRKHDIKGRFSGMKKEHGLGFAFPAPGGLSENIRWFLGNEVFLRQVDGEKRLYDYLSANREFIVDNIFPFFMIDALNCEKGCICGTGTEYGMDDKDTLLINFWHMKKGSYNAALSDAWNDSLKPVDRFAALNKYFSHLKLEDYIRTYSDCSELCRVKIPDQAELNKIFVSMNKLTDESRCINCSYCGYDNCNEMAVAVFNGFNYKENCIHYLKDLIVHNVLITDSMTGLPNIDGFYIYFNHLKSENLLDQYNAYYINLRGIGFINKKYGKEATDQIIMCCAEYLSYFIADDEFIGRFISDNFMVITKKGRTAELFSYISEIKTFIYSGGQKIPFSVYCTVGCLELDSSYDNGEDVISMCSLALKKAKDDHRLPYVFATTDMMQSILRQKQIMEIFPEALKAREFEVYYQPKVDTMHNRMVGAEALVRWNHEGQVVRPDEFIGILERDDSICSLDRYVFEQVCKHIRHWINHGIEPVRISTNFSRMNLLDSGFVKFIEDTLKHYRLPRKYIEVEITETASESDSELLSRFLNDMHKIGVSTAIDDFGTGYSSLNLLRDFPADVLKIDKSFIDRHTNTERGNIVLSNISRMASELNMDIITEGVENWEQVEFLRSINVNFVQGFLFDKPMNVSEFEKRLKQKDYYIR